MQKTAIILAGGSGLRAGGGVPKQFREIAGRPMIWHSMRAFKACDSAIRLILVGHTAWAEMMQSLLSALPPEDRYDYRFVAGGATRVESACNGLKNVAAGHDDLVAVHDAARPMVSSALIEAGYALAATQGSAVPVVPVTDSIRLYQEAGEELNRPSCVVDRSMYMAVQTPQFFNARRLQEAYAAVSPGTPFTDDASVYEARFQMPVALMAGESVNIKVTHPEDFAIAAQYLALRNE